MYLYDSHFWNMIKTFAIILEGLIRPIASFQSLLDISGWSGHFHDLIEVIIEVMRT